MDHDYLLAPTLGIIEIAAPTLEVIVSLKQRTSADRLFDLRFA